ncbi:hypothetical protein LTS18_007409, partial [Coniosporium uncinatum]
TPGLGGPMPEPIRRSLAELAREANGGGAVGYAAELPKRKSKWARWKERRRRQRQRVMAKEEGNWPEGAFMADGRVIGHKAKDSERRQKIRGRRNAVKPLISLQGRGDGAVAQPLSLDGEDGEEGECLSDEEAPDESWFLEGFPDAEPLSTIRDDAESSEAGKEGHSDYAALTEKWMAGARPRDRILEPGDTVTVSLPALYVVGRKDGELA